MNLKNISLLLIISIAQFCLCETDNIGNFALKTSQQPGPLFSFGQNIVDKGDLLLDEFPSHAATCSETFNDVTSQILYGFTDSFCLLLTIPSDRNNTQTIAGGAWWKNSLSLIGEYAYYTTDDDSDQQIQATVLAGIENSPNNTSLASKSSLDTCQTSSSSTRIIVGSTVGYTTCDWYMFVSLVDEFPTHWSKNRSDDLGNQFYYQGGIAYNINQGKDFILLGMLELDGQWWQSPQRFDNTNPDMPPLASNFNNSIMLCPSLFASWNNLIVQLGVQLPVFQHVVNKQDALILNATLSIAITF